MNDFTLNDCKSYYNKEDGYKDITWQSLANKHGYTSGEALRSAFKRERKKLNIPKQDTSIRRYPRIICFDIENTPMLVYTFSLWGDNLNPSNVMQESFMLCWSAKELNSSFVESDAITSEEAKNQDDERITRSLWDYLNGAHILIGHNIKDFDIKVMNTKFLLYGLPPISSFQIIDTLKIAREKFAFASNKLDFINKALGIKQKLENSGMKLWIGCMDGKKESLIEMLEYCKVDTSAVEELYYQFRPYITGHPNLGLFDDKLNSVCANCGSEDIEDNGFYFTSSGKYQSIRCKCCGALSRKRTSVINAEKKKGLLRN